VLYRLYRPEDFDALYAIEERCFEPPFRFGRSYMRQLVRSANAAPWIAEKDGRMVGFAIVEWAHRISGVPCDRSSSLGCKIGVTAYIQTIEVAPEARDRGVGRELLGRSEGSARRAGARLIWLHADAENAVAIRLYEAQGYCCKDRQEDYYPMGGAALIYVKRLDSGNTSKAVCKPVQ
jgi:ribosomal-protein-alanine N-acetyltransferase